MRPRRLRVIVTGESGSRLALTLAAVACLAGFVAAAGPRVVAAANVSAARTALAAVPAQQATIAVAASWFPEAGRADSVLAPGQQARFASALAAQFGPLVSAPAARRRLFVAGPLLRLPRAARSAMVAPGTGQLPRLQVSYDSGLRADAGLVAGGWPGAAATGLPGGSAGSRDALVLQVAVTSATAARFSLRPGSLQELGVLGGRPVWLRVTGIIRPRDTALFWGSTAVLAAPARQGPRSAQYWAGGVVVGQPEFTAMQRAQPATTLYGQWSFPVQTAHLRPGQLRPLAAAIDALTGSAAAETAARAAGFGFSGPPAASSGLPPELAMVRSQLSATSSVDSLVVDGLFAAGLLLMLLCAGQAAERYEAELALVRARGATLGQVALRALARACGTAGPGLAVGTGLALVAAPAAAAGLSGWLLPAATAAVAVAAVPARCTWRVRRADSARAARRADLAARQRSPRRVVAELTVLAVAAAAVVALRLGTGQLAVVSPVLVAIAAGIAVARLYPLPVRSLLALAARRRGPVAFLGLASTARTGPGAILPALALVLTLTLTTFGWMLATSVSAGQVAASWRQSGADAVVTAPGSDTISAAAARAVAAVPGVRHTALVYTTSSTSPFAPSLISPTGRAVAVGLVVVRPGRYAAMAADTPWPAFPAGSLARRGGPVPVLVSSGAAGHAGVDAAAGADETLELDGIRLPVVVSGGIGRTPAVPDGGAYLVLPEWAVGRFPSIAWPGRLLVTGSAATAALAAVAKREVPGGQYTFRADLLRAERTSAGEYGVALTVAACWAAAALGAVALLFGLAASEPARRALRTRMTGLGMTAGQARALLLFDPVPLLAVAAAGTVGSAAVLSLISRQVINLAALTGAPSPVPVSLTAPALVTPVLAAAVLALAAVAVENALASRAEAGVALRYEEGG